MKRTFEIEYSDDHGRLWMNRDNLMACLVAKCPNTTFTVRDVTGDECNSLPVTSGPNVKW